MKHEMMSCDRRDPKCSDGTTDVTRTLHFGQPSQHERECFTHVLRGHIALSLAVFPEGTPGLASSSSSSPRGGV